MRGTFDFSHVEGRVPTIADLDAGPQGEAEEAQVRRQGSFHVTPMIESTLFPWKSGSKPVSIV